MIFYHGTAALNLAAIKARGLIPAAGKGADEYAEKVLRWRKSIIKALHERPTGVYITRNKRIADWYAHMAAYVNGDEPVILEIDVPDADLWKLQHDEAGLADADPIDSPYGGRWPALIPPQWIVGNAPLERSPSPLPTYEEAIFQGFA